MIADIKKAKRAELEAELELYREGGVEGVAKNEDLANIEACREEIERLQTEFGFPVKLDPEFIAENKVLADHLIAGGAKEGDIVFAEPADLEEVAKIEAENKAKEAEANQGSDPVKPNDSKVIAVSVQFQGGVREFSQAIHGDDFQGLAKQFADKHKGTIL